MKGMKQRIQCHAWYIYSSLSFRLKKLDKQVGMILITWIVIWQRMWSFWGRIWIKNCGFSTPIPKNIFGSLILSPSFFGDIFLQASPPWFPQMSNFAKNNAFTKIFMYVYIYIYVCVCVGLFLPHSWAMIFVVWFPWKATGSFPVPHDQNLPGCLAGSPAIFAMLWMLMASSPSPK